MSDNHFYCEGCGERVPRTASECPSCGCHFESVKCPICGFTGGPGKFSDGCPSCGYMSKGKNGDQGPEFAVVSQNRKTRAGRKSRSAVKTKKSEALWPSWVYATLITVFSALLVGLLAFVFIGI